MNIIGIVPGRMASSRFPGKPLAKILGIPMIGHVYLRSRMCKTLNEVYVATCDKEIADYIASIGGKAVMTADTHQRASDRAAEALLKIEKKTAGRADIVVMIQGDEPLICPEMIDEALAPMLADDGVNITNLMADIETVEEFEDPNEVKVVVDSFDNALYFSREPVPSRKKVAGKVPMLKQVCVIPFRRDFLLEYTKMPPTPLEVIESVDMMRILENALNVRMVFTRHRTKAVDTKKDLEIVGRMMEGDRLFAKYGIREEKRKALA
jgi:3-deoxy-manno-octulosonate cytidylyltransferase (CMP-KDO synthetase)